MEKYYEIMVGGDPRLIKGFVIGFIEGRGDIDLRDNAFVTQHRIMDDSPIGMARHIFSEDHNTVPIVTGAKLCEPLCKAMLIHKEIFTRIQSVREIASAYFSFRYKTFSPEIGKSILELFSNLPPDVTLKDYYQPREKINSDSKGGGVYTSIHNYALKAFGTVRGGVRDINELYRKASRYDVVETGALNMEYGKTIDLYSDILEST